MRWIDFFGCVVCNCMEYFLSKCFLFVLICCFWVNCDSVFVIRFVVLGYGDCNVFILWDNSNMLLIVYIFIIYRVVLLEVLLDYYCLWNGRVCMYILESWVDVMNNLSRNWRRGGWSVCFFLLWLVFFLFKLNFISIEFYLCNSFFFIFVGLWD